MFNELFFNMNSVRLVHFENYQRSSGDVRHVEDGAECDVVDDAKGDSGEHKRVRRHLAPVR